MLKTRIIPVMLYNGLHLVKTIQFDRIRTLGNPTQIARVYNSRDVDELIFLDIMASAENREPRYEVIKDIMTECFMPVAIGGGIKCIEHIDQLMKIGADKVVINSIAIENPDFITAAAKKFGSQCVVVAIDAKKIDNDYYVFYNRASKNTKMKVTDWVKKVEALGAGEIFLNSIDNDGVMQGYDLKLIKKVTSSVHLPVIACGGAGELAHFSDPIIKGHANALSMASILHYTQHTPNNIKTVLAKDNIPVRIIN